MKERMMQDSKRIFLCPCEVYKNLKAFKKQLLIFLLVGGVIFGFDQWIKGLILDGMRYEGSVISIIYVLNDGVAFSMLSFLGENLKWIQLGFIVVLTYIFLASSDFLQHYYLPFAFLIGSGIANLWDRFMYGGVVDYIYWHYKFDFAVFNFADICINIGVAIWLLMIFLAKKRTS